MLLVVVAVILLVACTTTSHVAAITYAVLSKSVSSPHIFVTSNHSSIAHFEDAQDWIAYAEYSPASEHASNFAQLLLRTNGQYSDDEQTYAAGYLEGHVTAESIHQHYFNMLCQVTDSTIILIDIVCLMILIDIVCLMIFRFHRSIVPAMSAKSSLRSSASKTRGPIRRCARTQIALSGLT